MAQVAFKSERLGRTIVAGSGADDMLEGGLARDILDTGAGDNVVWADQALPSVIWSIAEASSTTGWSRIAYDRFAARALDAALEQTLGGGRKLSPGRQRELSDVINGGSGADVIFAGQGHDTIDAGGGADRVMAGGGDDVASGGAGNDVVDGGAGNDTLAGEAGSDTILGDDGADVVFGGVGADEIDGEGGNDTLWGGAEKDTETGDVLRGGGGNDSMAGEGGRDSLDGGAGRDAMAGGSGDDVLLGGAGADTLCGGAGNDVLEGGDDGDVLDGGAGADTLDGGAGNDTAVYSSDLRQAGQDVYRGGSGTDTLRLLLTAAQYEAFVDGLAPLLLRMTEETVDFSVLSTTGIAPLGLVVSGFEKLEVRIRCDPSAAGRTCDGDFTDAADRVDFDELPVGTRLGFAALGGDDEVLLASAGAAPDGYSSAALFEAGDGADTVIGRDRDDRVDGGTGRDRIWGGAGDDSLSGGAGADWLAGEAGINLIEAGDGDDTISLGRADTGMAEDGTIYTAVLKGSVDGGRGFDRLAGAAGSTLVVYDGSNIRSIETFAFAAGSDRVNLTGYGRAGQRYAVGMGGGNDSAAGSLGDDSMSGDGGNDRLDGSDGSDTLMGGSGKDWLAGGPGADLIDGGTGADTLTAGAGDDVLFGESGGDSLAAGGGSDAVYGGTGDDSLSGSSSSGDAAVLYGEDGNDVLVAGAGADALFGGDGADTLHGSGAGAYLSGGDGADLLIGAGCDTLNGGGGNDTILGQETDMLVLPGAEADYTVAWDAGSGRFTVTDGRSGHGEGADAVSGVGTFRFTSGDRTAEELRRSTVTQHTLLGEDGLQVRGTDVNTIVFEVLDALRRVRLDGAPASSLDPIGGGSVDRLVFTQYETLGSLLVDLDRGRWRIGNIVQGSIAEIEAITAGSAGDTLCGSGLAETLDGGAGDDDIVGGGGNDVLTGGEGTDRFIFAGAAGLVRITDFAPGDFVVIKPGGFGLPVMPSLFEGSRIDFSSEIDAPYVLFDATTHGLYLDRTGRDAQDATLMATLDGVRTLAGAVTFG